MKVHSRPRTCYTHVFFGGVVAGNQNQYAHSGHASESVCVCVWEMCREPVFFRWLRRSERGLFET